MIIHFFRNRKIERLDYAVLIDEYFDKIENSKISSNDDEVEVLIPFLHFDTSYKFLITKRSRVTSIYRLNPDFVSLYLLCEVSDTLPDFLYKQVLKQIADLCEKFQFEIYHDGLDNIVPFNMFNELKYMNNVKEHYYDTHTDIVKHTLPQSELNDICTYQYFIDKIPELVQSSVICNPYIVLRNVLTSKIELAMKWVVGTPMIFPEYLDYICMEEEGSLLTLVSKMDFFKHTGKLLYDVKNDSLAISFSYMNEKMASKQKKLVKKLRKNSIPLNNFETLSIVSLTEE